MQRYLRRADLNDKKLIFEWANDEETRRNSFNQDPILWENHEAWYDKKLKDENTIMYILMDFIKPIGMVRVDFEGNKGIISYSVAPDERGHGIGYEEIYLLEKELIENKNNRIVPDGEAIVLKAEVKKENIGSQKIFEKLGYLKKEEESELVYTKELTDAFVASDIIKQTKSRDPGPEILRVISMAMVIVLHYLNKGGLLHSVSEDMSVSNLGFWLLESLCICCVNVYVLISGYYMVKSRFTIGKVVGTVLRVLFYSVGITIVMLAFRLVENPDEILNLYNITFFCMPVTMGHYWFASSYVMMLIISPVLAMGANKMSKKMLKTCVILLITFFSILKSLLPFVSSYDNQGCDIVWFICLFMTAAYIRLYGENFIKTKGKAIFLYIVFSLCTWVYLILAGLINIKTENKYPHFMERVTDYNFIFVFLSAVCLFLVFRESKITLNPVTRLFVRIAPYTFGVYLLHEHNLIAYKWTGIFNVSGTYGVWRPLHIIASVFIIFTLGVIIDFLRDKLFKLISHIFIKCLKKYRYKE